AGDGRGRSAVEFADEEAFRIGGGEAGAVGEARIPAFGRRPVHGYRDFVRPHRPDAQVVLGGRSHRWAHETDNTSRKSSPANKTTWRGAVVQNSFFKETRKTKPEE